MLLITYDASFVNEVQPAHHLLMYTESWHGDNQMLSSNDEATKTNVYVIDDSEVEEEEPAASGLTVELSFCALARTRDIGDGAEPEFIPTYYDFRAFKIRTTTMQTYPQTAQGPEETFSDLTVGCFNLRTGSMFLTKGDVQNSFLFASIPAFIDEDAYPIIYVS